MLSLFRRFSKRTETAAPPVETDAPDADADAHAESWFVFTQAGERGPFTPEQIDRLIAAEKIHARTGVRAAHDEAFVAARNHPLLAVYFAESPPAMAPTDPFAEPERPHAPPAKGEASNFVIWASIISGDVNAFESDLLELGHVCRPGDELWVLRSESGANTIRKRLVGALKPGDRLIVVDAGRNRMAWMNLGAGAEVDLRGVWNRPADTPANAA